MGSSPSAHADTMRELSTMTIFNSDSCACWRWILSNPTSSATLFENLITAVLAKSAAYFSVTAATKLCGFSAGLVGLTKEAAVGDLDRPFDI